MKLGVFGGSFDPIHLGHLLLAETCREAAGLDRVWFLPAATPPHKQSKQLASDNARREMLELAIGGHEAFEISLLEINRGGVNYTFETLEAIANERPDDELFFLMGADSLVDFTGWREPGRICELSTPLVVSRFGSPEPDLGVLAPFVSAERLAQIQSHAIQAPVIDLSSSDIRARVAESKSIRYRTPRAVEMYIAANELYR